MKNFLPFFFVFLFLGVSLVAAGTYGAKLYGAGSYGIGQQPADTSSPGSSGSSPSPSTTSNASTTPLVEIPVVNWTSTQEAPVASVNSTTGYTVLLAPSARVQVTVENAVHFVGLVNVTGNSALLIVQSDPQLVTLNANEEKKLELSGDNYYDLYIKLNSVSNGSASFTIKTIHELASGTIAASNATASNEPSAQAPAAPSPSTGANSPALPLPLIAVVVLIIAVVAYYFLQNNKKQKGL